MSWHAWTSAELQRLKQLYPLLKMSELEIAFYPHPANSIRKMAHIVGAQKTKNWREICARHKPSIKFA